MDEIELSVIMPCLNEAETIQTCIRKARESLDHEAIKGEVIVADNGSTDGSQALARAAGARVITASLKGYGAAIRAGIQIAHGRFIVMGDADDSYDFSDIHKFIAKLREGYQLVVGNRFQGGIAPGAMPLLHRYLGNPVLSFIGRIFFKIRLGDFHCGLRGFHRDALINLRLATTGMEFASEMIVKGALGGLRIAEVPTTLSRDGRSRRPHLRTWRDGWRHLRFLLTYSPRWLFLYPGLTLLSLGAAIQALLFRGGVHLGSLGIDIHTMLYAAAMSVLGVQMVWFAIFTKTYGISAGFLPKDNRLEKFLSILTLERGLVIGLVLLVAGLSLSANAIFDWAKLSYGALDPREVMRVAIPSVSMILAGMEFVLASFFIGILRVEHHDSVSIASNTRENSHGHNCDCTPKQ